MSKQTLEIISIHKIELSTTNPRKVFDPKALEELSESIKEHGILQPILVRPYVDEKSSWQDYQLVCGERRYRAAILAGLEEVPVSIRVLTDDEAFELQIIENLERKDVHPLDEADAFKKMLDSKKYTIADISAKMAKPESFIVQRLKLVDLIESVREDFLRGHLGIGHAILISRCDEFKQKDIFDNAQPYKEGIPDYGTVKELKESKKILGFIDLKGLYEITAVEKQVENDVVTIAKKLLTMMDINLEIEITKSSEHFVLINLYGPDNGIIIGKKGKTLNSFEFLLNTLVKGCKVEVDVEGFKEKRANTLRDLARKMAEKAIQTDKAVKLNPMPPRERKIIHEIINKYEELDTYSEGKDPKRYIVIRKKKVG